MNRPSVAPIWAGALAGVVAAACGIGAGEVVAGLDERLRGPVAAVGDRVVDNVPTAVKTWAIDTFGTNDKEVLLAGVAILLSLFAAGIGILALRRSLRLGLVGVAAFAGIGVLASLGRGGSGWARPVPPIVAGLVAGWVLVALARRAPSANPDHTTGSDHQERRSTTFPVIGTDADEGAATQPAATALVVPGRGADRRRFLQLSAGFAGAAIVAGGVGRWMQSRAVAVGERLKVVLPKAAEPLPAIPDAAHADGTVPFITPNDDFYRIDTALVVPRVSTEGWTLEVKGRVDRTLTLTYAELLDRPMVEADITISCVSNEVGGDLIGTARWLGCRLDDLLDEAGIDPSADQIVGRSVDGFTAGFPTALLDGRPALVAVGMNGEALPIDHGYPARLIVPGVYGYVSATKWLSQIELTRFDEFDAYWIPRGWSRLGPIKTQSRIDTPRHGTETTAVTRVPIAGVAWAMDRRIAKVEVRIDGPDSADGLGTGDGSGTADGSGTGDGSGPADEGGTRPEGEWQEATLAEELNDTTWRQWSLTSWTPEAPGTYRITVRATDGEGRTQPEERSDVAPDGATGWHQVRVTVT